jgi:uncharacterized lipoprotein YmbA
MKSGARRDRVLWVSALAILTACSVLAPRPDPSRFFTLTPILEAPSASAALRGRALGIGPITLPPYLDRPELVIRVGPNEVRNSQFDYWAGSLKKQFESTLAHNLQILLSPSSIVFHPWFVATQPDVVVEVDVLEFERGPDGQAHLAARWRVRKGAQVVRAAESRLAEPTAEEPASMVAALSKLLDRFSREIAEAVK